MTSDVVFEEDNTDEILDELEEKMKIIYEMIGVKAEKYAKARCPVGTSESTGKKGYRGGTLRNSITHIATSSELTIGTNVVYAPYVELGTGPYFDTPPEWEQFESKKGSGVGKAYVKPRPFLRPAIEDHLELYKKIMHDVLEQ